jgi:hypothetical protein
MKKIEVRVGAGMKTQRRAMPTTFVSDGQQRSSDA